MARAAPFSLKFLLTRRLYQYLITTQKGSSSLFMNFYKTGRAEFAENTVAGIVPPRPNLTPTTVTIIARFAALRLVTLAMSKLKVETIDAASLLILAYSPNTSPAGRRTIVAKSNSQSRSLNGCSKLMSSPVGPPSRHVPLARPSGIPRIHPPAGHCSSSHP
jgi:hypothetical protein